MDDAKLLELLYEGDAYMHIDIDRGENKEAFRDVSVDFRYSGLRGNGEPDCKINHFGYNFYFRTRAGIKGVKYKTLQRAITEIKKTVLRNGGRVTELKIDNGKRTYQDNYIEYYKRFE